MSEPKYRYRIPPCPDYDIPAMESWLEDMAARGLHLSSDGFFMGLATFEEGPPRREKFRLEATTTQGGLFSREYDPEAGALELNAQMGWVHRARRGQFHIYSSADPHAPELHTDPQVQAMTLAALGKYLRKSIYNALFLAAFYLLVLYGDIIVSTALVLGTWRVALLGGLLLWDLGRKIRAVVTLAHHRRTLLQGGPLPHRSDYRRTRWRYLASNGLRRGLWAVFLCGVLVFLGPWLTEEDYAPLEHQPLPAAALADLYPGTEITRQNGILESKVHTWSDVLAPVCCEYTEYAQVTTEDRSFECYLTVQYFETRWEWTAQRLAEEFVSQAGANLPDQWAAQLFGNEPVTITALDIPGADYCVYYYKNLPDPYLVLRKGSVVIKIRYCPLSSAPALGPEELAAVFLSQMR